MYCTWQSKRNSSLICTLEFSAVLPFGWVSLFARHVLFVWGGNTGMSYLELVPAGKKLWYQVITQLGNAHTTTGTEGLTVWYPIIWTAGGNLEGFSLAFKGATFCLSISSGFDITGSFKRRRHKHVFTQSSFGVDFFLLWNFSKFVLKSF